MPPKRIKDDLDTTAGDGDHTKKMRKSELNDTCQQIFDALRNREATDTDSGGAPRLLCEHFLKLPTKKNNVDYYNNVKQPIDFTKIYTKVKGDEYETFDQFDGDMILLVSNAKQYYKRVSQEYKDAAELWDLYLEKKKELHDTIETLMSNVNRTSNRRRNAPKKSYDNDDTNGMDAVVGDAEANTSSEQMNVSSRKQTSTRQRRSNKSVESSEGLNSSKNSNNEAVVTPEQLHDYLEDYFDVIVTCQEGGRYISNIFQVLPSAQDYPDYYEIIKDPIDLKKVANKILSGKYKSIEQMESDLVLMINNAKRYNDPKSQLYKDACYLKKVISGTRNEIEGAIRANRPYTSGGPKTREKKHKSLKEVAEMQSDYMEPAHEDEEEEEEDGEEEEEEDDEEVDDEEMEHDDEEEGLDEDELEDEKERQKASAMDTGGDTQTGEYKNEILQKQLWVLYFHVKNYRFENETLIDEFVKLPSKQLYPDYYEEIKKPLSLNQIFYTVKMQRYSSLKGLLNDFELMFKNAMQYNMEGSPIYVNAKRLITMANEKFNRILALPKATLNQELRKFNKKLPGVPIQTPQQSQSPQKPAHLQKSLRRLFKYITDYTLNGRQLSKSFFKLPLNPSELMDYNQKIKGENIDLDRIRFKIDNNVYKKESDILNDFTRLFENCKLFYKSVNQQVYDDVLNLQSYLKQRYNSLEAPTVHKQSSTGHHGVGCGGASSLPGDSKLSSTVNSNSDLKDKLAYLYNYIDNYTDESFRELAYPFKLLPSKLDYPDYYNIIRKPMDMTRIQSNIVNKQSYQSVEEMCLDFGQIFENACLYNEPGSQIYRDALKLQKVLYQKRAEIDKPHESLDQLTGLPLFVQEIFDTIFNTVINYEDNDGRRLCDSFLELFNADISELDYRIPLSFDLIAYKLNKRYYKRLDQYQDELFEFFDFIRRRFSKKSQVYRDSLDLQLYYIQKRDEICKSGEVLVSNAFNFKQSQLEHGDLNISEDTILHDILGIDQVTATHTSLIGKEYRLVESFIINEIFTVNCGDFVRINKNSNEKLASLNDPIVVHVAGIYVGKEESDVKCFVQVYLKPTDIHGHVHKYILNELYQTDMYDVIDVSQIIANEKCFLLSIKDYLSHTIEYDNGDGADRLVELKDENAYVLESIYCTKEKLFRKIRKWQLIQALQHEQDLNVSFSKNTNNFINQQLLSNSLKLKLRSPPLASVQRVYLNLNELNDIKNKVNCYISKYLSLNRIENLSDTDIIHDRYKENIVLSQAQQVALQENENFVYYEQIFHRNNCFKLGDYVYIREDGTGSNLTILRIDKLWKSSLDQTEDNVYVKGPKFLRPLDISHEPTRVFYKNEVFKENKKECIKSLRHYHGRCLVLSQKRYQTCRPTQIPESDVYVCDLKYDSDHKTLRKFAKGLKKFELSLKCYEDELYFFKKELQFYKQLSPLLADDNYEVNLNLPPQALMLHDDYTNNSFMSASENANTMQHESMNVSYTGTPSKASKSRMSFEGGGVDSMDSKPKKKKRVKRSKKCGYNIFSREFRQKLRDENSPLTFIEMSREVGNHWRLLTDVERQHYEDRAVEESAKEAVKEAAREAVKQAAMAAANERSKASDPKHFQLQQQQQHHLNTSLVPQHHPSPGAHINQIFNSPANVAKHQSYMQQPQQQQQQQYGIINVAPSNAVQLNLNYGANTVQNILSAPSQQTAYIIKQNDATNIATIQLNNYQHQDQQQQHQVHIIQQPMQQQQPQKPPVFVNPPQRPPQRPMHTEAYMKYIENLKRNQDSHFNKPISNNWQAMLDIRPSQIKESNCTTPIPTSWIENIPQQNVYKHLMSLRYYLLNDAINIRKQCEDEGGLECGYEYDDQQDDDVVCEDKQPEQMVID